MPWHILLPFLLLGVLVGASQFKETSNNTPPAQTPDEREERIGL